MKRALSLALMPFLITIFLGAYEHSSFPKNIVIVSQNKDEVLRGPVFGVFVENNLDGEFTDTDVEVTYWTKNGCESLIIPPHSKSYIAEYKDLQTQFEKNDDEDEYEVFLKISYKKTTRGFLGIYSNTSSRSYRLCQAGVLSDYTNTDPDKSDDLVIHVINDDLEYSAKSHFGRRPSKELGAFIKSFPKKLDQDSLTED